MYDRLSARASYDRSALDFQLPAEYTTVSPANLTRDEDDD